MRNRLYFLVGLSVATVAVGLFISRSPVIAPGASTPSPMAPGLSVQSLPSQSGATAPAVTGTFQERLLGWASGKLSPEQAAAGLKSLYREDPEALFAALLSLSDTSVESHRSLLPLLANALMFWPEAEGRYIFPVADAYSSMDLPAAGEWAVDFLIATGREDLAVTSILGRMTRDSEALAFSLIETLPEGARIKALQAAAYHVSTEDISRLKALCTRLDPDGSVKFSSMLFQRLAVDDPRKAAKWLTDDAAAAAIPGAAAAIAEGLVIAGNGPEAITWADGLPVPSARAQAIAKVYQRWAQLDPENAVKDILSGYPEATHLVSEVFKGAAEHHGCGPLSHWETATKLENESARAYATSALIEPLLLTVGQRETLARVSNLTAGSIERLAAELTLEAALLKPQVVIALEQKAKITAASH